MSYSVILKGFTRGEEWFRGRMLKQGAKAAQIEKIIGAVPCVLKHGLQLEQAKQMEAMFRDAGGDVEVRLDEAGAAVGTPAPTPVAAPAPPAPAPAAPQVPPLATEAGGEPLAATRRGRVARPSVSLELDVPAGAEQQSLELESSASLAAAIAVDRTPGGDALTFDASADDGPMDLVRGPAHIKDATPGAAAATPSPAVTFKSGAAGAALEPAEDPGVLDLLDGPPAGGVAPMPGSVAPMPGAGPAVDPRLAPPPGQGPGVPGVPGAGAIPGVAQKPPAEWKSYNPWWGRGIAIGVVVITLFVFQACVGKYKVADKLHDFSVVSETELEDELMKVGRKNGTATKQDVVAILNEFAKRTDVTIEIIDIMEEPIYSDAPPAEMMGEPGGPGIGLTRGCAASPPEKMMATMTPAKHMEWAQMMQTCTIPRFGVGFAANVTARFGLHKSSVYVEHWAWAWRYTPEDELE